MCGISWNASGLLVVLNVAVPACSPNQELKLLFYDNDESYNDYVYIEIFFLALVNFGNMRG